MSKKPGKDAPPTDAPAGSDNTKPRITRAERKAQEAKRQLNKRRHRLLFILVLGSLAVNAAIGYYLHGSMVVDKQRERVAGAADKTASSAAQEIADYLAAREAEVTRWASQPGLIEALKNGQRPQAITEPIVRDHGELLALRAFPAGTADIDREHRAPLRYAELVMLRRNSKRQPTLPEAAPVDDGWQLQIARPVPPEGEGSAPGALLATYKSDAIDTIIQSAASGGLGRAALNQRYTGQAPNTLTITGSGQATEPTEREVPGTDMSVVFTPSAQLVSQSKELPGMWIVTVSLCVVIGLILSMVASRLIVRPKTGPAGEGLSLPQSYQDARGKDDASAPAPNEDSQQPGTLYQNQDILDIDVIEEDEDILGLDDDQAAQRQPQPAASEAPVREVPAEIFRAYDIRGKVDEALTPELAREIGLAVGSEVQDQGEDTVIVARDGRTHSPVLTEQLISGILASGCHVMDIGVVPTPLMNFATCELTETTSGVMVTASHNAAEYNGFKIVIGGETLSDGGIQDIRSRIERQHYLEGEGEHSRCDVIADYIERIFSDVALAGEIKIVIDAGNTVTGAVAPALFEELGCEVVPLYCELDGNFPNHNPDPTVEANLQDLIAKVKETDADLGVAFDGDGDRLMVVTPSGRIIWPDQLLMLFAKDVLSRNPGADVLFDVKCSKQLNQLVSGYGGRPIMWKTGHAHMKRKMTETGALIGGEYSGHIFISERWYGFDDGLYTAARLLEIITLRDQPLDEVFAAFPMLPATPDIRVPVAEADKFALIDKLIESGDFKGGKVNTIDGLRVDFAKGWGLVRASNTGPQITLRFEAESEELLGKLQQLFKRELKKIDKSLKLEF